MGSTELKPISKNPPTKPASITTGLARTACHRPTSPTRAVALSASCGRRGIKAVQASPMSIKPMTMRRAAGSSAPSQASKAGPTTMVMPIMVAYAPIKRPRCFGGENSAMKASANTQRIPPAMAPSSNSTNQAANWSVNKNPQAVMSGVIDANHKALRRPSLRAIADAKGETTKMPSHSVAANKPATVFDTSARFSKKSSSGSSINTPHS